MIIIGLRWVTLIPDLEVRVGPITEDVMAAAQSACTAAMAEAETDDFPARLRGHRAYVNAVARGTMTDWRGVGYQATDEGGDEPISFRPDLIDDLMQHEVVHQAFDEQVVMPHLMQVMEKNALSPLRNGSSQREGTGTVGRA